MGDGLEIMKEWKKTKKPIEPSEIDWSVVFKIGLEKYLENIRKEKERAFGKWFLGQ